jgi:hypothetical protein
VGGAKVSMESEALETIEALRRELSESRHAWHATANRFLARAHAAEARAEDLCACIRYYEDGLKALRAAAPVFIRSSAARAQQQLKGFEASLPLGHAYEESRDGKGFDGLGVCVKCFRNREDHEAKPEREPLPLGHEFRNPFGRDECVVSALPFPTATLPVRCWRPRADHEAKP